MGLIVVTGEHFNNLEGCAVAPTASAALVSGLGIANLYDRIPAVPAMFTAAGTDVYIHADLNIVVNGDMETNNAGDVAGWTEANTGTGNVTRTTAGGEFNSGTAGMKLASGTGTAVALKDVTVRSGSRQNVTFAGKGTGAVPVKFRVWNPGTGHWLKSDGTWDPAQQDLYTQTAAAWATMAALNFTVEAFSVTLYDEVTLRIYAVCETAAATVFADDVYMWPDTDVLAVIGHNLRPVVVPEWRHSTDAFVGSNNVVATMTIGRPSFYALGASSRRYQRLKLAGTSDRAPYIGELVLTQKRVLLRQASPQLKMKFQDPQTRAATTGARRKYLQGAERLRTYTMKLMHEEASYQEFRDEVFGRGRGGATNGLFIPLDSKPEVLYGDFEDSIEVVTDFPMVPHFELTTWSFTELPLPTFLT